MESLDRIMTLQANLWWRSFLDDPDYGHYKLKRLKGSISSHYELRLSVVPLVELEEYKTIESDRIPFLIGSQFGTYPRPEDVFNDGKERTVAILGFSMLSGNMGGVTIYKYKGAKAIFKLHSIDFPHHIKMNEILPFPFPEVLQVEFGFKKQPPLYSEKAEIARTPVQQFQNMSYRNDFIPRRSNLGRTRNMLLVNEYKGITPMHLMSKAREFDLGYFTFNAQQFMTGCGIIPGTETKMLGQSFKLFHESYVLLTPIDYYYAFKKRYHNAIDWDGIKLSWRQLCSMDALKNPLS